MALADIQVLVDELVRDAAAAIAAASRDRAIDLAVTRYSVDRPRSLTRDVVAGAAGAIPWPAEFDEARSVVLAVEQPAGEIPPALLAAEDWQVYQGLTGPVLLLARAPAEGDSLRLRFTLPHLVDATNDTLPPEDVEAVASWAAALLCDQLATLYAGESDPTIAGDLVQSRSKSADYARRAAALRKRYTDHLGVDDKRNAAHGVVVAPIERDSRGDARLFRRRSRWPGSA